jgi:CheY-like chemotaxis protein
MTVSSRIVLCIDDDEDDREMVCFTINQIDPSFDVIHAENGLVALDLLQRAKETQKLPCLIILDLNMPKMDGKKTLEAIKKDRKLSELPVVLFTTSNSQLDKQYCANHGVELVTKPSSLIDIKHEVQRLLKHCDGTGN